MEKALTGQHLLATSSGSDRAPILVNSQGFFEPKQPGQKSIQSQHLKKVFELKKKPYLKIIKSQIKNSQYTFCIRITQDLQARDICISGKESLQKFFKMTSHYSLILGLQEMVVSFKKIGQGAFAQVYEVLTRFQQRFALKSFEKKNFQEAKTKASFHKEIEILKTLGSPYIIPFDYLFETDKAFYLKMEFLEVTLKQKCGEKLLIQQQKKFVRELLLALREMRGKNIIHRDLKPENIMIRKKATGEEECVVIDFGLATNADEKEYLFVRCGTPGFLAPEIANCANRKERQTCAIDMYSLGCIFFKIITGHYLFGGKSAKEVLLNNKKGVFNQTYFSRLSQKQKNLLLRMTDPNPTTRITPQEALEDPYFDSDIDDSDEIPEEECDVNKYLRRMSLPSPIKNMETINSSCGSLLAQNSVTSRAYRLKGRQSIKDSCITFQFGNHLISEESLRQTSKGSKLRTSHRSPTPDKASLKTSRFSTQPQNFTKII